MEAGRCDMTSRIAELIGIAIIGAAMLLPAPRLTFHSPQLLYTMAIYKSAMGDTDTALRLLRQAEADTQKVAATGHTFSTCREAM